MLSDFLVVEDGVSEGGALFFVHGDYIAHTDKLLFSLFQTNQKCKACHPLDMQLTKTDIFTLKYQTMTLNVMVQQFNNDSKNIYLSEMSHIM